MDDFFEKKKKDGIVGRNRTTKESEREKKVGAPQDLNTAQPEEGVICAKI